jgi:hypothetical protein
LNLLLDFYPKIISEKIDKLYFILENSNKSLNIFLDIQSNRKQVGICLSIRNSTAIKDKNEIILNEKFEKLKICNDLNFKMEYPKKF